LKKIFLMIIISVELFASWCVSCGKPLDEKRLSLTLPNGKTREYCSIYCKAKDIKRYSLKSDINLSKIDTKKYDKYLKNIKRKKLYDMGKKIYKHRCKKIDDLDIYLDISDLEEDLFKNYCKNLDEQRTWYVSLYLWDKFHHSLVDENKESIKVSKDEKCPVCGMFVYKYPRWVAQIFLPDGSHLSFDGVKDMTKYLNSHKVAVKKILVTDYYTQKAIDGKKAFYVIGSDVYGPMGEEAIPFENDEDAKNFLKDHRGKKILKLEEVRF